MDSEIIIGILKVTGSLVSGALGLTALFSNYRNGDGKLNKGGKIVLGAIVLSSGVATVSSGLEAVSTYQENKDQLARNERLMHEVSRSLLPISRIKVASFLSFSASNEGLLAYQARIEKTIEERLPDLRPTSFPRKWKGLKSSSLGLSGEVQSVSIEKDSDLWPVARGEEEIATVVELASLSVSILKDPVPTRDLLGLDAPVDVSAFKVLPDRTPSIFWRRDTRELQFLSSWEFDKELWRTTGRVVAFPDLQGAQLVLTLPTTDKSKFALPGRQRRLVPSKPDLAVGLDLDWVSLDFGDGRSFAIDGQRFTRERDYLGRAIFILELPSTIDGFKTLQGDPAT